MVWKMTWGIRQVLTRALESIKNWDFDGMILLSKVEIVWAQNLQRSYVSWQWRMIQKLKRNWLVVLRLTWGIWRILTQALESLKTLCFNGLLLTKVYIMFELKKDRGVIFDDTEEWCKIWKKTDLQFEKWNEKFGKFSPEHLKVLKLGLWWDIFVQSRDCMSLKLTEKLNAKFEVEFTCHFKIDMKNWRILTQELENLKSFLFNWLLWPKYITFEQKRLQRSYVWWHLRCKINQYICIYIYIYIYTYRSIYRYIYICNR